MSKASTGKRAVNEQGEHGEARGEWTERARGRARRGERGRMSKASTGKRAVNEQGAAAREARGEWTERAAGGARANKFAPRGLRATKPAFAGWDATDRDRVWQRAALGEYPIFPTRPARLDPTRDGGFLWRPGRLSARRHAPAFPPACGA